jgi:hypothetical protein
MLLIGANKVGQQKDIEQAITIKDYLKEKEEI